MPVQHIGALPVGSDVVIDANIFIYALSNRSQGCKAFLERCAREDILGITTVEVINEVTHRVMLAEAVAKGFIQRENASQLRAQSSTIKILSDYWTLVSRLFSINILILGLEESRVLRASPLRKVHGLMTNDSMILAAIDEFGIGCLVTHDSDFDHIPGITVYKPTDIT